MKPLNHLLDSVRKFVRRIMKGIATGLNQMTGGRLSPDSVTIVGLLAHVPIAYLIASGHFYWAAGLLVVFGLFDTLDGELARLQNRSSSAGMLLDASTDRFKEVMLYAGAAAVFIKSPYPGYAVWAVVACGASLCVSYVKAKGEVAVKDSKLSANEINRLFQDGLLRFEIRMAVLVLGLATHHLHWAVVVTAVLASFTAVERLIKIRRQL